MVIIGSDVRKCQYCGGVLSFRDDCGFCRKCEEEVNEVAMEINNRCH